MLNTWVSGEDILNGLLTKGRKIISITIYEIVTTYGLQPYDNMLKPIPPPDVRRASDALADLERKLGSGPARFITAPQNDWDQICKEMRANRYDEVKFEQRMEPILALRKYLDTCKARRGTIESWDGFDFYQSFDGKGFSEETEEREIERLASAAVLYRRADVEKVLATAAKAERDEHKDARQEAVEDRRDAMIEVAEKLWEKPGRNGRFLTKNQICEHPDMLKVAVLKNGKNMKTKAIWMAIKHLNPDTRPGIRPKS